MAIEYVGGTVLAFAGTTSNTTVSLTSLTGGIASAPAADDLVLVHFGVGAFAPQSQTIVTSGYTTIDLLNVNETYDPTLLIARKFMGGTPDTQVEVSGTGGTSNSGCVVVQVFRGVDQTTPFDVTTVTASGTDSSQANPPSITPTTSGAKIVATGCGAINDYSSDPFSSSDLEDFLSGKENDSITSSTGAGWYDWTSGAFDPAEFGGFRTDATSGWVAATMALRPAAGGGSVTHATTGVLSGAGSVLSGSASRVGNHASSGALAGAGSSLTGSASRFRVHGASGSLSGAGSTLAGSASRASGSVSHATTGALAGAGAVLSGAATRFRVHGASGGLAGAGAVLSGSAARASGPVTHSTSGALSGGGATMAGVAALVKTHTATGALVGAGSSIRATVTNGTTVLPEPQLPETYRNADWPRKAAKIVNRTTARVRDLEAATDWSLLEDYADDTAAAAGGVEIGQLYRNGSVLMVRVS